MEIFNLPYTTKVAKIIPKNSFDDYCRSNQKKQFTDLISRITWLNKISSDTVNLEAKEIKEIQIFKVELKTKETIKPLLDIIDKAIPYTIIFIVEHDNLTYLSTSIKHPHPIDENNSVIDWTFQTVWFLPSENSYILYLKKDLDAVYYEFCLQLSATPRTPIKYLQDLIQFNKQVNLLEKEISQLQKSIKSCNQYKIKVELNLRLKQKQIELKTIIS